MNFTESQAAIKGNMQACERIIGRPLTDGEYVYIARSVGKLEQHKLARKLDLARLAQVPA